MDVESGVDGRTGRVSVTVDGEPDVSERQLSFQTTNVVLIGGENAVCYRTRSCKPAPRYFYFIFFTGASCLSDYCIVMQFCITFSFKLTVFNVNFFVQAPQLKLEDL